MSQTAANVLEKDQLGREHHAIRILHHEEECPAGRPKRGQIDPRCDAAALRADALQPAIIFAGGLVGRVLHGCIRGRKRPLGGVRGLGAQGLVLAHDSDVRRKKGPTSMRNPVLTGL